MLEILALSYIILQNQGGLMDTTKWKSILVPRDVYEEIIVIAHVEARTISGQLRYIFENWKLDHLSPNDQEYIAEKVLENKNDKKPLSWRKDENFNRTTVARGFGKGPATIGPQKRSRCDYYGCG
jgi:hypothetical protein